MRVPIQVALAFAAVLFTILPAQAAETDNILPTASYYPQCQSGTFSDGVICLTDNATVRFYLQSSVDSTTADSVKNRLNSVFDDKTDLTVIQTADPSYSGSGETDIIYQVGGTGWTGSLAGKTWCNNEANLSECDQAYVRFRDSGVDKELACHESGHAVGLTHGAQAYPVESNSDGDLLKCMETPVTGDYTGLGENNIDNVNSVY